MKTVSCFHFTKGFQRLIISSTWFAEKKEKKLIFEKSTSNQDMEPGTQAQTTRFKKPRLRWPRFLWGEYQPINGFIIILNSNLKSATMKVICAMTAYKSLPTSPGQILVPLTLFIRHIPGNHTVKKKKMTQLVKKNDLMKIFPQPNFKSG